MSIESSGNATHLHGTFAIFLFIGLTEKQKNELNETFCGQVGMAGWVSEYAPIVSEFFDNDERDYPGVFAYEIVEEMGEWLGNNPYASAVVFKQELTRRTDTWIAKSQQVTR